MLSIIENISMIGISGIAVSLIVAQSIIALYMFIHLRIAAKEQAALSKEMFGLLKKLEGLTASKREQMLKHYDQILDNLSTRLPPTIAAHAGETIFETESKILSRLAELDPSLTKDGENKKKMEELVRSMESLEHTIISLTADTVKKVMVEARHSLMDEEKGFNSSLAA